MNPITGPNNLVSGQIRNRGQPRLLWQTRRTALQHQLQRQLRRGCVGAEASPQPANGARHSAQRPTREPIIRRPPSQQFAVCHPVRRLPLHHHPHPLLPRRRRTTYHLADSFRCPTPHRQLFANCARPPAHERRLPRRTCARHYSDKTISSPKHFGSPPAPYGDRSTTLSDFRCELCCGSPFHNPNSSSLTVPDARFPP